MSVVANLPDNFEWRENDGLYRLGKTKEEKLCNAIPEVTTYKEIVNRKLGTSRTVVEGKYHFANGETEAFCFPVEKILSGKFMEDLSINVLIEMEKKRAVTQVFRYSIQSQIANKKPAKEWECDFGWDDTTYKFEGQRKLFRRLEHVYEMQLSRQIVDSDGIVTGFILAAIHGPLKKLLLDAGIQHDFTTCVSGRSGVGKTSLARAYCRYLHKQETAFSLGSDRKELKKKIRDKSDVTVLIDDLNTSNSDRVVNHGIQTLAEIIQLSSDSCQILVDDKSNQTSGNVHIITTVENVLTNISTINRCFLIHMEDKVPDSCWRELKDFIDRDGMWRFMMHFMEYISEHYSVLVKNAREDYKYYLSTKKWINHDIEHSRERIVNTYAVQNVLFKILVDYFRQMKIDMKLIREVSEIGRNSIYEGCQLVVDSIEGTLKKLSYTQYLPELLNIFIDAICHGGIAYKEKKYRECPDRYDFLCIHEGYISFVAKDICDKIAYNLGQDKISSKALTKELQHFGVAKVDLQGLCSFVWGTKKRMLHVRGVDLLQAIKPDAGVKEIRMVKIALNLEEQGEGIPGFLAKYGC